MIEVENYENCMAELRKKRRNLSLLLGNGFEGKFGTDLFYIFAALSADPRYPVFHVCVSNVHMGRSPVPARTCAGD